MHFGFEKGDGGPASLDHVSSPKLHLRSAKRKRLCMVKRYRMQDKIRLKLNKIPRKIRFFAWDGSDAVQVVGDPNVHPQNENNFHIQIEARPLSPA